MGGRRVEGGAESSPGSTFQRTSTIVPPTKAFSNFTAHPPHQPEFPIATACLPTTECSSERNTDPQTSLLDFTRVFTVEVQGPGLGGTGLKAQ